MSQGVIGSRRHATLQTAWKERRLASRDRRFDIWYLSDALAHPGRDVIARRVGVNTVTINRWVREGLSRISADRAACSIGLHPANVWTDWWFEWELDPNNPWHTTAR